MDNLTHEQAEFLWAIIKGLSAVIGLLFSLVAGLAVGFRWLDTRITETATKLLEPVSTRVTVAQNAADAAHRRIDAIVGPRP